jgi:DNA-binding beta-propeller fold protein YncE
MSASVYRHGLRLSVAIGLVLITAAAGRVASAAADPTVTQVMGALDNPRGLAFGPQGALYVAEAGRGGQGPCVSIGGIQFCYGPSGAVSRLWMGVQERVASGLPSIAQVGNPTIPDGTRAEGPNDITMLGVGSAEVTIGLERDPAVRGLFPEFASLGRLVHVPASGEWRFVADLAAYEQANNPDQALYSPFPGGGLPDSNPYGLLEEPEGSIVADAGGNDLLRIDANGEISVLAVMPPVPAARDGSSVPTSIAVGPDGAYYVGQLTGAPFVDGAASIYRVLPGEVPQVFLTGFKAIIDIAFDEEGNLFVLQHATGPTGLLGPGKLIRVTPDGTRTTVLEGLTRPTSVAVGPDGAVYVTNNGLSAGAGQVLRIEP